MTQRLSVPLAAALIVGLSLLMACQSDPLEAGWALYREGDIDGARTVFEALAVKEKTQRQAEDALGEIALSQLDLDRAIEHFTRAYRADPKDAFAHVGEGEALLRLDRQQEAYAAFLKALDLSSDEAIAVRIAGLLGDAYATTRLTRTTTDNYSPRFMPNGKKIVFASHRDGNGEIMILPLDTLQAQRLIEMPQTNEYAASYTPDGSLLLFSSVQYHTNAAMITLHGSGSASRNEIFYVRDVRTGETRPLSSSAIAAGNPTLSPDGRKIAFEAIVERNLDIWTMDIDGKNRTRLTTSEEDDGRPTFTPDGTRIVFVQTQDRNFELMEMTADGKDIRQVTFTPYNEFGGSFSPDGREFVYSRQQGQHRIELALMDWKTRRSRAISHGIGDNLQPSFSPDGTQIVFASDRSDYLELYLMDLTRPVQADTLKRQLRARLDLSGSASGHIRARTPRHAIPKEERTSLAALRHEPGRAVLRSR